MDATTPVDRGFRPGDTAYYLPPLWRSEEHYSGIPAVVADVLEPGVLYSVAVFPVNEDPAHPFGSTVVATSRRLIPRECD